MSKALGECVVVEAGGEPVIRCYNPELAYVLMVQEDVIRKEYENE